MMAMPSLLLPGSAAASYHAAEDGQKQQRADSSTETDDERFIVVYPGFHFSTNGTSLTLALK